MSLEDKVIKVLEDRQAPVSLLWLAKTLKEDKNDIKVALKKLISEKIIRKTTKLYFLNEIGTKKQEPKEKSSKSKKTVKSQKNDETIGFIDSHPDGYAFFVPEKRGTDLFIPQSRLGTAVHGDKVRIKKARFKGKYEAHVVEVIERNLTQLVGRVELRRRHYIIKPLHKKFTIPIFVRKSEIKLSEDDVVLCRIKKYPDKYSDAEGEVVSLLGNIYDKGIENIIVMSKFNLNREFSQEVEDYSAKRAEILPKPSDLKNRKDFTKLYTVTIDGDTARDFDDAVSIEKSKNGYALYVHIADVAQYVEEGSVLDEEAYNRGTSVYFPEFAIHMLPEVLSKSACSLKPNEDRFALTVKIDYNNKGERVKTGFFESVIRSDYRLTYAQVNRILAGEEKAESKEMRSLIDNSVELMNLLKERRHKEGTIDFNLPDVEFVFGDDGNITDILPEQRGLSERVIEFFMIDTNEAVAEELSKIAPFSIYRCHDKPDLAKLINWDKFVQSFGISVGKVPEQITPKLIQQWFEKVNRSSYAYLLESTLVRSMQRAEYSVENIGHFGLASKCYTHFTSPIRRYPDLIVHRLLKRCLFNRSKSLTEEYLESAATQSSQRERNAEDAEREVHQYKKLAYLRKNAGNVYKAYINRIAGTGFFVFLEELLMVGYVDGSYLPKGQYFFDIENGIVQGKKGGNAYKLGDIIDVVWVRSDMDRLEADFAPSDSIKQKTKNLKRF